MTGQDLKQILTHNGMSLSAVAEKLGMSQQNFSASLKVADIKTGLLEKICSVYGFGMDFFYPADLDVLQVQKDTVGLMGTVSELRERNLELEKKLQDKKDEFSELQSKYIALLEKMSEENSRASQTA